MWQAKVTDDGEGRDWFYGVDAGSEHDADCLARDLIDTGIREVEVAQADTVRGMYRLRAEEIPDDCGKVHFVCRRIDL